MSRSQREAVKAELQKLLKALRKRGAVTGKPLVIMARVPIIKCILAFKGLHMPADISLGVANGLSAVAFVEQQVLACP
jgi:DNA polymerase sigma